MKKGWQTKNLGDLCKIELGKTPARANSAYWDERHETSNVWLSIADLLNEEDNIVVDGKEYLSNKGAAICKLVPKGTLLVSFKLTLGRLAFAGRDLFTNEAIAALTIFNEHELSKEFLFYCLTFFDWVKAAENDVKLKGMTLNKAKLKVMPISLPPFPEQQRIVAILDKAFEGIAIAKANTEKNLQNAKAIFESHLQSVFTKRGEGWVKNKLKPITLKIGSGATPRGGGESYKTEGISLIRSLNVHDLGFKYAKLAFLDDAQADELSNVEVQPRDVLLNITGASVARCVIVPNDVLPARVNQHVSIIRPISDKLDADFLHYLLISKPYKDQLLKTGEEGGSTRQAITKAQIQEFLVEYPATLKEQKIIVAKLDTVLAESQHLIGIYEQKLVALEALKKSLLNEAFSGNL